MTDSNSNLSNNASFAAFATAMEQSCDGEINVMDSFKIAWRDDATVDHASARALWLELDCARYYRKFSEPRMAWSECVLNGRRAATARGIATKDASMKPGEVRRTVMDDAAWACAKVTRTNAIKALDLLSAAEKEVAAKKLAESAATKKENAATRAIEAEKIIRDKVARESSPVSDITPAFAKSDDLAAFALMLRAKIVKVCEVNAFANGSPAFACLMKAADDLATLVPKPEPVKEPEPVKVARKPRAAK